MRIGQIDRGLCQEVWILRFQFRPSVRLLAVAKYAKIVIVTGGPASEHAALLQLVGLDRSMALAIGSPSVLIGVLDGPVAADHPGFAPGALLGRGWPALNHGAALHGTLVTGVLAARRDSGAPGICPGCRVLPRPIFSDDHGALSADPADVGDGIIECVDAGARLLNISAAFTVSSALGHARLAQALDYSASRGALVVAAAGNAGRVGGSPLVSHPWVIPVGSCDDRGHPLAGGNLGSSIGQRGVLAPGTGITSLAPDGRYAQLTGTSAAAALVTGALALAWSAAPEMPAARVRAALLGVRSRRRTIVPPLLDAWSLYQSVEALPQEVYA